MRLVCISDTHNTHKTLHLPDGDVLIHAGDATGQGLSLEVERFLAWFASQAHPHKILVAGNHDWLFQRHPDMAAQLLAAHPGITYLQDSGVEIEGIRFWGSPWQPWFCDWAFNLPRKGAAIREVWNRIPLGTDVLITHGPPWGVLDQVHGGPHLGCEELKIRLVAVQPRVHVFGHIHDSYGVAQSKVTTYVNACSCDEEYRASHQPIVLDLTPKAIRIQGIDPNVRLERLKRLKESMKPSEGDLREKVLYGLLPHQLDGLHDMADISGMRTEALLQDYIERGLQSDLAKHLRSENKPSRQPIPFTTLEEGRAEE